MLSHALHPKAGKLLGHEVQIPTTWIVIHEGTNPAIRFSVVNAWTAKGYARNWRHETLFTEVSLVSRLPEPGDAAIQPPTHAKIISTRTLSSGGTAMTCWEYIPDYIDWGMWRTFVDCSSSKGDFGATFVGDKDYLPTFYSMLENARQTE